MKNVWVNGCLDIERVPNTPFIRHILTISEFLANKWSGTWTNEIAGRGGVQEARFDCALSMPPYIPSLVAVRYRNSGFVRRDSCY
jgi:hypothetical protein